MGMLFPILSVLFHKDSGKPSGSESPYEHEKIRCEGWTMLNPLRLLSAPIRANAITPAAREGHIAANRPRAVRAKERARRNDMTPLEAITAQHTVRKYNERHPFAVQDKA
jgi:hypothetical protein